MAYNATSQAAGIRYQLNDENLTTEFNGLVFWFSTLKHKDKFDNLLKMRCDWLNDSLSRRFHVPVNFEELAAVQLYMMIEGRGFKVYCQWLNEIYDSPSQMNFSLMLEMV